jgi:hypothetical protein
MRRAFTAAACPVLILFATATSAQTADPVGATELFSQGREAIKMGDFDRACPLFAESNRLDPKVGTLLNLAECEEKRGHLAQASQAWQQAVNLAEATSDARGQIAADRLAALTPRVPRLTIRVARDSPRGTRIFRDDVELGDVMLDRPFPVDPGAHRIVALAPDGTRRTFLVHLAEGEETAIAVTARSAALPPKPSERAPRPAPAASGKRRTIAYMLGGVGVAGIATGLVTGAMLMSHRNTVDGHCQPDGSCDATGADAAASGKRLVPINTVAWVVGAVGLGAGTWLYLTSTPSGGTSSVPGAAHARCTGALVQVGGLF